MPAPDGSAAHRPGDARPADGALARRLGLGDAVVVGLGAMLGAGVFVAFGPAAAAAGPALAPALVLAGLLAWANADSTARLAALHPTSGGAYTYGRARLGPAWGGLAGWAFLLGKTLSAGAATWGVGAYAWPAHARTVAVATVVALTALAAGGVRRGAAVTRVVVAVTALTLLSLAVAAAAGTGQDLQRGGPPVAPADVPVTAFGLLQGAGVLFFAFAGYARIATLGEEVRDPRRTLPRAVATALAVVLVLYAATAWALVTVLGVGGVAASDRPVADAAARLGLPGAVVVVGAVAALAAAGSALGVLLGLSRTTLAMARDGALPRRLAVLSGPADEPRPVRAQLAVGVVVVVGLLLVDLPTALALSSTAVLVYYGVAHAAATTLGGSRLRRLVPVAGLAGCVTVAGALVTGLLAAT